MGIVNKIKTSYLGNPKIKKAGISIDWTKETIAEWAKCKDDPVYFIRTYTKIVNVDKGLIPFEMYDFQEEMVNLFHDNRQAIVRCSRQIGKSTTVIMYVLWMVLFKEYQSVAVLAHNGGQAKKTLAALKLAYEHLPFWLQQGVVEWNKGSIELENGSIVKSCSTGSSAARGGSHTCVILDEFAFVQPNVAEEFFKSVYPTISSGKSTKLFIISTPNGMNHFWKFWKAAEDKKSDFVPFTAYWWQVPWKDDEWKKREIANMGSEKDFEQEHGVEFLGAEGTLVSGHTVAQKMRQAEAKEIYMGINVYERPRIDAENPDNSDQYFITVDVSKGQGLDYHAFTVWNTSRLPYTQAATFRDNELDTMLFPNILASVGHYYNSAPILIESNIASEVGYLLFSELEYENVLWTKKDDKGKVQLKYGGGGKARIGVDTTQSVKSLGCAALKSLIENDQIKIIDKNMIAEFTTFTAKGKSFEAQEGSNDDLVMTAVIFAWATRQDLFKDLSNNDARKVIIDQKQEDDVVNLRLPFGFRTGGQQEEEETFSDGNYLWHIVK